MPKVGSKHFPYTKKGYQEAKSYAKKSGKMLKLKGSIGGGAVIRKRQGK